jgi:hypothetical protein
MAHRPPERLLWTLHRPPEHLLDDYGVTCAPTNITDAQLVSRIAAAYTNAIQTDSGENFWVTVFGPLKRIIHEALTSGEIEPLARLLRDPASNMLLYGFDILTAGAPKSRSTKLLNLRNRL